MKVAIGFAARIALAAFGLVLLLPTAHATDGVIEINHIRALAGGITPGDTLGYPVTISQPGSYRLTSNLTQPDKDTAVIQIDADGVSIDLNGFAITGSNLCTYNIGPVSVTCASTGIGDGVVSSIGENLSIRNGALRGLGRHGIFSPSSDMRVNNVSVSHCGGIGINLQYGSISHSNISFNASHGILATTVNADANVLYRNGENGIRAEDGVFSHNTSQFNVSSGIFMGNGVVESNDSSNNTAYGLNVSGSFGGTVAMRGNVFNGNGGGSTNVGFGYTLLSPGNTNACAGAAC